MKSKIDECKGGQIVPLPPDNKWMEGMIDMKVVCFIISLVFVCLFSVYGNEIDSVFQCDYRGQKPPGEIPVKFAPGIVSTNDLEHSSPQISPDGMEMFWVSIAMPLDTNSKTIWYMKREGSVWKEKCPAPFNSGYNDDSPVFSPDGKRLYFTSSRPRPEGMDGIIWYVERNEDGWSEPVYEAALNTGERKRGLSFARNGNVYCSAKNPATANESGICLCRFTGDGYNEPEPLGERINKPGYLCWTPFIAPDESYLIYSLSVGELSSAKDYGNLYISFHLPDGTWSDPIDLGDEINTPAQERFPYVTPDGKYLFFTRWTREGNQDVFWVKNTVVKKLHREFKEKLRTEN